MAAWGTRVQLCGRFAVERDGLRVESALPGRQGVLVVGHLAAHPDRWVTRDELIDAVWGDLPPGNAPDALASLLSKVRRVIGPSRVEGRSELRFMLDDHTFVDAHYAIDALHRAQAAASNGDWPSAWHPAHTAHHVARRTFLLGLEAPWIQQWRHRMADVSVSALLCHGESLLRLSRNSAAEAERIGRQLIELAPFRESGYRLLMEALEQQGSPAEALRIYDALRCLLADELGVAPGPEVSAVHARLIRA